MYVPTSDPHIPFPKKGYELRRVSPSDVCVTCATSSAASSASVETFSRPLTGSGAGSSAGLITAEMGSSISGWKWGEMGPQK